MVAIYSPLLILSNESTSPALSSTLTLYDWAESTVSHMNLTDLPSGLQVERGLVGVGGLLSGMQLRLKLSKKAIVARFSLLRGEPRLSLTVTGTSVTPG